MEDENKARHSRIERALAVLKPEEKQRLEAAQVRLEVALAHEYADQLQESTVQNLVQGLVIEPEALTDIYGAAIGSELPNDSSGWRMYAKELVERSDDAKSDVAHANKAAIASHKQQALNELNPGQRMNWARNGTLDAYLTGKANEALQKDLDARRG